MIGRERGRERERERNRERQREVAWYPQRVLLQQARQPDAPGWLRQQPARHCRLREQGSQKDQGGAATEIRHGVCIA